MSFAPIRDWSIVDAAKRVEVIRTPDESLARYLELYNLVGELRRGLGTASSDRAARISDKIQQRQCFRRLAEVRQVSFGSSQAGTDRSNATAE